MVYNKKKAKEHAGNFVFSVIFCPFVQSAAFETTPTLPKRQKRKLTQIELGVTDEVWFQTNMERL